MEEKQDHPTIQMKNSSIVIVKIQRVLYSVYFLFYCSSRSLFVNLDVQNARNVKRKSCERTLKGLPLRKALFTY